MSESLEQLVLSANALTDRIVETGGELTPDLEQALELSERDLAEKVDACAVVLERLDHEAAYWKDKAASYAKIGKACEAARERLRERIKGSLIMLGQQELVGQDVRFRLSPAKARLLIDETNLSSEWKIQVTTTEPDKERIRAMLDDGLEIPGARLEPGWSLRQYANRKS